jgi:class 3 adenylate cyclase
MEILRAHDVIFQRQVVAHGGSLVKHTGDGIFAAFPTASGALACAVAIQRALISLGMEEGVPGLGVRIGLHAGEPVAQEGDLFGTTVILAQRICRRAPAGGILVSETVRELARGKEFVFAARGRVALKGFAERFRVYEVLVNSGLP